MVHSFDIEVAKEIGVNCAIILNNLYFWIEKNVANEVNYHDGMYWTYNSIKAFEEIFPYFTGKQIRSSLQKLIDDGIIITGNYNCSSYDRTTWYAITNKGYSILLKGQIHLPKWENGSDQKGEPIPDNKPDNKPDNNNYGDSDKNDNDSLSPDPSPSPTPDDDDKIKKRDIDAFFEATWKVFPKKKGKGFVSDAKKKKLYTEVGLEQMLRCIDRYKDYIRGKDEKYVMYGSTFFNSGYVDYLDANCEDLSYEEDNLPFK